MTRTATPDLAWRFRHAVNRGLQRSGYELRRVPPPRRPGPRIHEPPRPPTDAELAALCAHRDSTDRLLHRPTFILSTMRSGSTLLRLILDSHPQVCAPHELHLRRVDASAQGAGAFAMSELGLDARELRYLLWDRVLHRELQRSGKTHYVNKTPTDALIWADIVACWPDARFVFLRRDPAAVVDSWYAAHQETHTRDELARDVHAFATGMDQAYRAHGGLVVHYEALTTDPGTEVRRLCDYLGVEWRPAMLDYGTAPHAGLRRGLGDWSTKVRSGAVQPSAARPSGALPDVLRPIAASWGYA